MTDQNFSYISQVFNAFQDGIIVINKDMKIIQANEWMLSRAPELKRAKDLHCYDLLSSEKEICKDCPVRETFKDGKSHRIISDKAYFSKSDSIFEITTYPLRNKNGEIEQIVKLYKDITKQLQTENRLKEANQKLEKQNQILLDNKEKYNAFFTNAPLAYQSLNEQGHILEVNPKWLEELGYEQKEVIGKWFGDFLHSDYVPYFKKHFSQFKKQGYAHDVQFKMQRKDGKPIYTSFEGSIGYNPDGKFRQTYSTFKNITSEHNTAEDIKKFKAISDNALYGNAIATTDGIIVYCNKYLAKIHGYKPEELIGKHITIFHHESKIPEVLSIFENIKAGTIPDTIELFHMHKNGNEFPMLMSFTSIDDEFGNPKHYSTTAFDLTEIKKAETKIKSQKDFLLFLINNIPNQIFWKDKNLIYQGCNQAFAEMAGVKSPDEIIGKKDSDFIVSSTYCKAYNEWDKKVINSGKRHYNIEEKYLNHDGTESILLTSKVPLMNKKNEIEGVLGFCVDITKMKQNQIELTESKNHLKKIFQVAPTGIGQAKNRIITDANHRICEMTGYSENELQNTTTRMLYSTEEEYISTGELIYDQIRELGTATVEAKWKRKDGKIIDVLLSCTEKEKNIGDDSIIFTALDISQTKNYEREIIAKNKEYEILNENLKIAKEKAEEANKLKTEFLNNMSHEIRTPMNGIMGFADLLENEDSTDEERIYFTKIIKNSSKQLLRIIDDILEISTLETKQIKVNKQTFCLNEFLMEKFSVFSLKAKEKNLHIYLNKERQNGKCQITLDKSKLNKIMSNLIENALKFTYEGSIEIGYRIENDRIILYVKDTGIGIEEEKQSIIFERFSQGDKETTKKHGGLGLGLSISKENAELLGGTISLISQKEKGSTFYVSIPYDINKFNADNPSIESTLPDDNKITILVAEDEEVNYLYLEALFRKENPNKYKIIHAKNGESAVDICLNNHIDIVLMDIKMPVMSGLEATKLIKQKKPDLPIIAQTAYSTDSERELALKFGCNGFLSKPIHRTELFQTIAIYCPKEDKNN